MKSFKGFDKNLVCREFQYEIGQTYKHDGKVVKCASGGFHSCEYPLDIFSFYNPADSRFCVVELAGDIDKDDCDTKLASAEITIKAEIKLPEMIASAIDWIMSKVDKSKENICNEDKSHASNTGYHSAASNTGYCSAASNTGNCSAASNTGNCSAASNTGDCSAASNTGYYSAASNTGNYSAASAEGNNAVAMASGYDSKAKASLGSAIVLVYRNNEYELIHIKSAIVDGKKLKANTYYKLDKNGKFVEQKD